jgi:hypothetical protein
MATYSEKLALAAGSVAVATAPVAADAKVVHVQPLSVQLGYGPSSAAWDIDGQYGPDFYLNANQSRVYWSDRTSGGDNWYGGGLINFYSQQNGTINIQAIGSNKLLKQGGLAQLHNSAVVGQTLAGGYNFAASARILGTDVYQHGWRQYPYKTFTGTGWSSWTWTASTKTYLDPAESSSQIFSNLQRGSNTIGFSFDAGGSTHYGWANLYIGGGFAPIVSITNWAFEDQPDTPIHVSSVPAPPAAVPALTLLAMGAAGLRRWRQK